MFLEDIIGLMKATIIFPNNLFTDKSVLDKKNKIYLFQDPLFFQDLKYPVKFNKKKIFMHLLSMEEYYNNLISLGYDAELVHFYKFSWPLDQKLILTIQLQLLMMVQLLVKILKYGIGFIYVKMLK